jgi:NADH:ubiquinone oxidoreductase subunit 6 (subunit J)
MDDIVWVVVVVVAVVFVFLFVWMLLSVFELFAECWRNATVCKTFIYSLGQ